MTNIFDNHKVQIECPSCGAQKKKTLGWMKLNQEFHCRCGQKIFLKMSSSFQEILSCEKPLQAIQQKIIDQMNQRNQVSSGP